VPNLLPLVFINGLLVILAPVSPAELISALLEQMLRIGTLLQVDSLLLCLLTGSFLPRDGLRCSRMNKMHE
jgi:hypothetical protein